MALERLIGRLLRLALVTVVLATVVLVVLVQVPARYVPSAVPIDEVRYLDQGWGSAADSPARQTYYYTPQGASLHDLRYDWLVHLEMPWGSRRFADPAHLRAYGFAVDAQPTRANPDQLPVGFARRFDPALGEAVVDLGCAACHTGELVVERQGRRTAIRVDGGPATHAFLSTRLGQLVPTLTAALASTYFNPVKFRRFARAVLGDRYDAGKWKLHADLGRVLRSFVGQGWHEQRAHLYPVEEGYGRVDSLARGTNTLLAGALEGGNEAVGEAPVRYPYLWDAWKLERLQYDASASPTLGQPMAKALGAGARVQMLDAYGRPLPADERYRTSVRLEDLHRIERTLQALQPPRWPEDLLGPVDDRLVARGRDLFAQHCARCHAAVEVSPALRAADAPQRGEQDPLWGTPLVPLEEIGTDPSAVLERAGRSADLRRAGIGREEVKAVLGPVLAEYGRRLAWLEPHAPLPADGGDGPEPSAAVEVHARRGQLASLAALLDRLEPQRVPIGVALAFFGVSARTRYYDARGFTPEQRACLDGFGALDLPQTPAGYRARPLAGVWAAGPFLHNGSVPTLYQLLSPQDERDTRFRVVPGAFDPVQVGVDRTAKGDGFWYDTRQPGNSNVGHEFRDGWAGAKGGPQYGVIGPALSPDERRALVEYLKVHRDPETPPGRVAPDCGLR